MCAHNLSLALIGCLHIKPMIIGNYLSLNKKRKNGCVLLWCSCYDLLCSFKGMWMAKHNSSSNLKLSIWELTCYFCRMGFRCPSTLHWTWKKTDFKGSLSGCSSERTICVPRVHLLNTVLKSIFREVLSKLSDLMRLVIFRISFCKGNFSFRITLAYLHIMFKSLRKTCAGKHFS